MTPMKCAVADNQRNERHVRSLFVSDVHLGCRYAQPENFLALLESIRPDELYILGDFLDPVPGAGGHGSCSFVCPRSLDRAGGAPEGQKV